MSEIIEVLNQGNFAIFNKNVAKTFIFDNKFQTETIINPTGGELTYPIGTLMGRISASLKLIPLASGAADGSQFPVGILAQEVTLGAGAEVENKAICISGEVAEEMVSLDGSDTFDTLISARTIRDRIAADTMGIKLVVADELTAHDNS